MRAQKSRELKSVSVIPLALRNNTRAGLESSPKALRIKKGTVYLDVVISPTILKPVIDFVLHVTQPL